jgi:hypothetical protein
MKRIATSILITLSLVVGAVGTFLPAQSALAIDPFKAACGGSGGGAGSSAGSGTASGGSSTEICGAAQQDKFQNIIKNVINTALVVIGMIAVIMIVIGGVKYVVSNGEAQQIQSAKNTILYSVIGLVLAVMAFPIVNFVLDKFK